MQQRAIVEKFEVLQLTQASPIHSSFFFFFSSHAFLSWSNKSKSGLALKYTVTNITLIYSVFLLCFVRLGGEQSWLLRTALLLEMGHHIFSSALDYTVTVVTTVVLSRQIKTASVLFCLFIYSSVESQLLRSEWAGIIQKIQQELVSLNQEASVP